MNINEHQFFEEKASSFANDYAAKMVEAIKGEMKSSSSPMIKMAVLAMPATQWDRMVGAIAANAEVCFLEGVKLAMSNAVAFADSRAKE